MARRQKQHHSPSGLVYGDFPSYRPRYRTVQLPTMLLLEMGAAFVVLLRTFCIMVEGLILCSMVNRIGEPEGNRVLIGR